MGFFNAIGTMLGLEPNMPAGAAPGVTDNMRSREQTMYGTPSTMAPNPSVPKPPDLLPAGTNISPILTAPTPDVKESSAATTQDPDKNKSGGMSIGV